MTDAAGRRTVLLLPFFTGAGILLQTHAAVGVPPLAAVAIFAAVLAAALVPRGRGAALALVPLCFLAAGSLRARGIFPPQDGLHLAGQVRARTEATLLGTVVTVRGRDRGRSRFILECDGIATGPDGFHPCRGRVGLVMYGETPADIAAGDRVAVRAMLRPAGTMMTPGADDYRLHLAASGVWTTGTVIKNLVVRLTAAGRPSPAALLERARQRAGEFVSGTVGGDAGAIYRALLTGDTSAIRPGLRRIFARTGTAHLLAISGMHMGAILVIVMALVTVAAAAWPRLLLLAPRRKIAGAAALAPLAAYALIAGMKPPVFRALVMTWALILLVAADRRHSPAAALAMAATLVMLVFPASLLAASFQLSFAAVWVIVMLWNRVGPWRARLAGRRLLAVPTAAALSGVAAQAGVLPFSLLHFNLVSPLAIPATMLLLPLLCFWALPLGLAALAAAPFSPGAAGLMLRAGAPAVNAVVAAAGRMAALPWAAVRVPDPHPVLVAAYLAAIAITYLRARRPASFLAALVLLPALLVAACFAVPAVERRLTPRPRVAILDVGQGSATVVFTPGGRVLLIDAGGSASPRFDPGERVIARYLFHEGISRVDTMVLTHSHADHTCGLAAVAEIFRPRAIWTNADTAREMAGVLARAAARGARVAVAGTGARLYHEPGAELVCLRGGGGERGNRGSLALLYRGGGLRLLLPGDAPVRVQREMAAAGLVPECDVLLAPHHGSPAYFDPAFARAAAAGLVAVSTGRNGRIAPQWRRAAPLFAATAEGGTIVAAAGRDGVRVTRPWQDLALDFRPR